MLMKIFQKLNDLFNGVLIVICNSKIWLFVITKNHLAEELNLKGKLDMETKVKYIVGNLLIQEPILL